jgi:hypothetical protein
MSNYFTVPAVALLHLEVLLLQEIQHLVPSADSIAGARCTGQIWVLCRVRGSAAAIIVPRLSARTVVLSTAGTSPSTIPTFGWRCFLIKNGGTNPSLEHAPLDKEGRFSEQACLPEKRGDFFLINI